jgi:hypothetical protein
MRLDLGHTVPQTQALNLVDTLRIILGMSGLSTTIPALIDTRAGNQIPAVRRR